MARFIQRLQVKGGHEIEVFTDSKDIGADLYKLDVKAKALDIDASGSFIISRLKTTDELIKQTGTLTVGEYDLPLWKLLALDDFVGSQILLGAKLPSTIEGDFVIVPMMCVDNNSKEASAIYTWLITEARKKGIPTCGVEVSPIGNKNTMSQLPCDYYLVKTPWEKRFMVSEGLARADQVFVLRWEEVYLLQHEGIAYPEAFMVKEEEMRGLLGGIPSDQVVILIPHHVAFSYESQKLIGAIPEMGFDPEKLTVVIRVEPRTTRRQYSEKELVTKAYGKELSRLKRVVIDERIGTGLLLQLADLVLATNGNIVTEFSNFAQTPTLIYQSMHRSSCQGEFIVWVSDAEAIPAVVNGWREDFALNRVSAAQAINSMIESR